MRAFKHTNFLGKQSNKVQRMTSRAVCLHNKQLQESIVSKCTDSVLVECCIVPENSAVRGTERQVLQNRYNGLSLLLTLPFSI